MMVQQRACLQLEAGGSQEHRFGLFLETRLQVRRYQDGLWRFLSVLIHLRGFLWDVMFLQIPSHQNRDAYLNAALHGQWLTE